jgi:hypothetical protein
MQTMRVRFLQILVALLLISTAAMAQRKIVVLSPQVTIQGNLPNKWTEAQVSQLRNQLATSYQSQVVSKLIRERNKNRNRGMRVDIIALKSGEQVPVGTDIAYVVIPRVNHVIYMSPAQANMINTSSAFVNFNTPFWSPYVRANDSYCSVNVNEGNTRNVVISNRIMSNRVANRLFKWIR